MKRRGRPPDPTTREEWQEAVDQAAFLRALWDCHLYGLLEGDVFRGRHGREGGAINVRRCDYILDKGRRRGVRPAPLEDLAGRYLTADPVAPAAATGGE